MKLSEAMRPNDSGHDDVQLIGRVGWVSPVRIETNTDGYCVISNNSQLQSYLNTFGDVEVEWDSTDKVYRVPAFRVEIEKYNAAKTAQCKIWGCE